ncbi:PREDICTED: glycine receptor subunit alpha-2-like [Branchiostoma belcheri]|uniref:Glycine receptor subunit alpha-2-like n=1 Tax=Branchiostoma belcheri TaxID=7741 RepID=A0A6P4YBL0_BRABE|nr:PREDICTED: glycine receptor subunit alpha-2-like [Branchiostoma belcheri]
MSRLSLFSLAVSCICFLRYDATSTKTTYRGSAGCRAAGSETGGSSTAGYSGGSLSDWETWQAFRTGDRLPGNYSKTVRPNDDERWTGVSCGVRLSDIGSLSETSMKFEARFDMTLEWTDPRLAGLTMGLAPIPIRYLWTPDIRFGQETEVLSESDSGNDMDDNTITTWIFPDGKIAYKKSYEGRIKCAMSLQSYPMDRQDCTFQIHAYNGVHLRLEPNFEWTASAPLTTDLPSVHSQFQIYSVQIRSFANSFLDTAEATANTYTSLEITLSFRRLLSSHLFELFIPCVTIVCLSWVAFWINRAAVPARVALGITTVLTMVTQATRVVGMPHVSYVRAIDVWVLACQAFVFLALIEYAVVNYLMNNANKAKPFCLSQLTKAKAKPAVSPTEGLPRLENKSNLAGKPAYHAAKVDNSEKDQTASPLPTNLSKLSFFVLNNNKLEKSKNKEKEEGKDKASIIDETSRVVFPMAFLLFNIVYWLYYYDYF